MFYDYVNLIFACIWLFFIMFSIHWMGYGFINNQSGEDPAQLYEMYLKLILL